jgi:hypothetical protein
MYDQLMKSPAMRERPLLVHESSSESEESEKHPGLEETVDADEEDEEVLVFCCFVFHFLIAMYTGEYDCSKTKVQGSQSET